MHILPEAIIDLAEEFLNFPGIGRKNAQKLALDILKLDPNKFSNLNEKMLKMRKTINFCDNCGFFSEDKICNICKDKKRSENQICLVENSIDILNLEKSNAYFGKYFVLDKLISPLNNIFPENTKIPQLFTLRIPKIIDKFEEIELIFFLKNNFNSETTIAYIKQIVKDKKLEKKIKITRLAQGLPLYFNPDSLDIATIAQAINDRKEI